MSTVCESFLPVTAMARSGDDRMFRTGLLLLTKPIHKLTLSIPQLLSGAFQLVHETLYIHLVPDVLSTSKAALGNIPCTENIRRFVLDTYVSSSTICSGPDIRFLLGNITIEPATAAEQHHVLKSTCQVVITQEMAADSRGALLQYVIKNFPTKEDIAMETITLDTVHPVQLSDYPGLRDQSRTHDSGLVTTYDNVAVGGTFDNLHIGHKILLTEACLHANKSVTVGVTDTCMNTNKVLSELIRPTDARIKEVLGFLKDIKPALQYTVTPITDPYGPTLVDASLQCLVVSEETLRGGQSVNLKRKERAMNSLDVVTIDIVEDSCHSSNEEVKISSSSLRKRLLGMLLREPKPNPGLRPSPYIIGLTGGIGSGKSSVCHRLQGQGAAIVDCDKLGVYLIPGGASDFGGHGFSCNSVTVRCHVTVICKFF
ncbi:Bifunctional coenzyme A synthase [Lamellibrachia satsuma]|nr:Bifunctional coenzyme A synthase [Lamellibrachia satsuma]